MKQDFEHFLKTNVLTREDLPQRDIDNSSISIFETVPSIVISGELLKSGLK